MTYSINGRHYTHAEIEALRAEYRWYANRGDWDISERLRKALASATPVSA